MLPMRRAILLLAVTVGCATPKPATEPAAPAPAADAPAVVESPVPVVPSVAPPEPPIAQVEGPRDAQKAVQQFFEISFLDLKVPQGSISQNEAFWKPFDETFLGLWQHDVLNKNGLRVGRATVAELSYLQKEVDGADADEKKLIGTESKDFEMEVRTNIPRQTIFYADRNGEFEGRDYEASDDLFAITFHRAPRHQDRVCIAIAPMIRGHKQKFAIANPETLQVRMVPPETLYDLGVQVELALNECLVIAPSSAALENPSLVGRAFLMEDRPAERIEHVLVIIPRRQGTLTETTPGVAQR